MTKLPTRTIGAKVPDSARRRPRTAFHMGKRRSTSRRAILSEVWLAPGTITVPNTSFKVTAATISPARNSRISTAMGATTGRRDFGAAGTQWASASVLDFAMAAL